MRTYLYIIAATFILSSCEKYVDIDKAPSQLLISDAFKADATATSAVLTLYSEGATTNCLAYFSFLGGITSDEMIYTQSSEPSFTEFQQTVVSINNSDVLNYLWYNPYIVIARSNVAINGLTASTTMSAAVKKQLLGECKFFRAFFYFNLVNYFGKVPLALSGDPLVDSYLPRSSTDSVWAQIISDLKDAQNLLPTAYVGTLRTRVNQYTATALLARAYLYTKDYAKAAVEASKVIEATDITYGMPDPTTAFLNSSNEVIFQIAPTTAWSNLPFLGTFYISYGEFALSPSMTASFETGDQRKTAWTKDSVINKYKMAGGEYNIVLRLAEQYLIRAEARAQQNTNISGAQSDLDAVRLRAGLTNTSATTQSDLLTAIAQERKVELFGEYSHRWFDLKRTDKADAVLGTLKSATWKPTAVLMPIPASEIIKNGALTQNDGYPK
jgi:starch-binding outer membrane protein, SusD/RagB family